MKGVTNYATATKKLKILKRSFYSIRGGSHVAQYTQLWLGSDEALNFFGTMIGSLQGGDDTYDGQS